MMAVCFKCGATKSVAFVPCPECAAFPQTEDDLALSLAMSDDCSDSVTLEQMRAAVREGKPLHLDPEGHAQLIENIRSSGLLAKFQGMFGGVGASQDSLQQDRPAPKKPWWRFW